MIVRISFYIGIVNLMILCCYPDVFVLSSTDDNNPPEVVITKPAANAKLSWNSIVPYSIHVNDPEDGNSDYDEIMAQEVLLMVSYLPNSDDANKYLNKNADEVPTALIQMSKSTCLLCHASKAKLIGPSFELIANRYNGDRNAAELLREKVIAGSTGTWGELKMPPHPDVEIEELKKMIDWILKNGANPSQAFYTGIEGAFQTKEKPDDESGSYVITANYTDHGTSELSKSVKHGRHTLLLGLE